LVQCLRLLHTGTCYIYGINRFPDASIFINNSCSTGNQLDFDNYFA